MSRLWSFAPLVAAALSVGAISSAQAQGGRQYIGPNGPLLPPIKDGAPDTATIPSISQILQQAAQAAATLNYSGTIIYQRRGAAETARIVHLYENGVELERMTTLDGPPLEVVRVNEELTTYFPDSKVMRIEPRTGRQGFPSLLPKQMGTLSQYYTVKKLEVERVAGLEAQTWLFEPNDEFRFWHKIWTELKTGLWLRGRVIDEQGNIIEEITFSDINMGGKIDRNQVKPTLVSSIEQWRVDRRPLQKNAPNSDSKWDAKGLPPGFTKVSEKYMRSLPGRSEPVTQMVYSDGLTSVSVYIAPVADSLRGEKLTMGASNQGVHQMFTRQMDDQLVVAFGDARPLAVRAIANALSRKPQP